MTNKKEVANVATVQSDVPDYLKGNKPAVLDDNFDASDVSIPRIKLLQGTSPEVEAFDNAKPGSFWHTGMDAPLPPDVTFIVCARRKKALLVAPLTDGQGILARSDDAKTWDKMGEWEVKFKDRKEPVKWKIDALDVGASGLLEWGTQFPEDEDSPPAATLFYDYLVIFPDHLDWGPAVLSLARSQIRPARRGLNDKITLHAQNGRPLQSLAFTATAIKESNSDNQDYYNFRFSSAGFATEELFKMAEDLSGLLAEKTIQGETDDIQTPSESEAVDDGKGNF